MSDRILVINPNSSEDVTARMSAALDSLRFDNGPVVDCMTLVEGPPGIETDRHIAEVAGPITATIEREHNRTSAFVIACFSDPGIHAARDVSRVPVFGIGESSYAMALTRGDRFGVISILSRSVPRHRRQIASLGLLDRLGADIGIDIGVTELSQTERVRARMAEVGAELRDGHGCDVLVMGCAGMAQYRGGLESDLGIPVIDPTQAATTMAIGAIQAARQ